MTPFEFCVIAINKAKAEAKAKGKEYKGLHTVYSGFNEDVRVLFGQGKTGDELKAFPILLVKELVSQNKLDMHYAHGGAMLYLKGEMPEMKAKPKTKDDVFKKYNLAPPPVVAPKGRTKTATTPQPSAA
jgi:hypothetical protein